MGGRPKPSREAVDAALARLNEERQRISDALLELDGHPGRQMLEGAELEGATAGRWEAASAAGARLWTCFDAYCGALEQAWRLRGSGRIGDRQLEELGELLEGRSVVLSGPAAPLGQRALTDPAEPSESLTLAEAVERMTTAYREQSAVAAAAQEVWEQLLPGLDAARARLTAAARAAGGAAPGSSPEGSDLARLEEELAGLRRQVERDPLALWSAEGPRVRTPAALGGFQARLDQLATEIERDAASRLQSERRLEQAGEELGRLAAVEAAAAAERERVAVKIADAEVPAAPAETAALRGRAAQLGELRRAGHWISLADALPALERDLVAAFEAARRRHAEIAAPLERRSELRGLLEGYRAKAVSFGLAEEPELDRLHQAAHGLLWTAPCALAEAEEAVAAFQAAVNRLTRGRVRR